MRDRLRVAGYVLVPLAATHRHPEVTRLSPARHPLPHVPIGGAMLGATHQIGADMRELRLDGVAVPEAAFIEKA